MTTLSAWRLMLGTLTVLPVRAPERVDRAVAGRAMALAPVGGLLLGVLVAGAIFALGEARPLDPLIGAVLAIGLLALLTRGMHLDGLADTADGLGSGRRGDAALEVMRKSDIGPFGVVTLVLVLLLQVAALRYGLLAQHGLLLLAAAVVASRAVLPLLCSGLFGPARSDGLGSTVARSVGWPGLVVSLLLAAALVVGIVLGGDAATGGVFSGAVTLRILLACGLAVLAGLALATHAARRFGGITGDVLGASVETAFTAALLLGVILP